MMVRRQYPHDPMNQAEREILAHRLEELRQDIRYLGYFAVVSAALIFGTMTIIWLVLGGRNFGN